jgi:hypothetical protein
LDLNDSLVTNAQVGAFAIAGIPGGTIDVNETDLPDSRLSMAAQVNITSSQIVNTPGRHPI